MSDAISDPPTSTPVDASTPEFSRRALIGGLTAAGALGLAASAAVPGGVTSAAPIGQIEALDPVTAGLEYLPLDAFAFDTAQATQTPFRLYQTPFVMQPSAVPASLRASLPIPAGSTIRRLDVSYAGIPEIALFGRSMTNGAIVPLHGAFPALDPGSGVKTRTYTTGPIVLTHGSTYFLEVTCPAGASIVGVIVGYEPPARGFVPYTGGQPRALDTREAGLTRFAANEERVIDLSSRLGTSARAAVINLTAVDVGGGGFLSAYADGIQWPGNSTVNYATPGQTVANGAIVTMTNGRIRVRAGVNGAHVIVDVVGSLF